MNTIVQLSPEARIAELEARLAEAEETLEAIRSGGVDALVISRPEGDQIFTLQGAETIYRVLVEEMNEGALLLGADGTILYANARFARWAGAPPEQVTGSRWERFFVAADQPRLAALLSAAQTACLREEFQMRNGAPAGRPVSVSLCRMHREEMSGLSVVVTDLTDRKATEAALREANEKLEQRSQHLRQLAAALTRAEETERQRIAQFLHDGLQQMLAGARLRFDTQVLQDPGGSRYTAGFQVRLTDRF